MADERRPEMIVVAGPNGSGKTSVTRLFLRHQWALGTTYINPDEVANEMFGDWNSGEAVLRAADYCAQWRERCLDERRAFVFETVMSAQDKVDFILRAKSKGFFIRLFFISTNSPTINAARIARRVMEGGHDVPISKVVSRYYRAVNNCKAVSGVVDRLYVYDNSEDNVDAKLLFRLAGGSLVRRYVDVVPQWAAAILPH